MNEPNNFFDEGQKHYFWKGRVALYCILKALGITPDDEVILPGYTCVVVANAIHYLGAKPIYADIDPLTYNITADKIKPLISPNTRVIIVQNTFGLSPDLDPILDLAAQHNIMVIEDCAHGLGAMYKDQPSGTITDAAFFSTQWSKPVSTGLGGMAYIRHQSLNEKVTELVEKMPSASLFSQLILLAQWLIRPLADLPSFHYPLVSLYRWITQKLGLSVGSSVGIELTSITMPDGFLRRMGGIQQWILKRKLNKLDLILENRQTVANRYDSFFSDTPLDIPFRPDYAKHAMLRYAIRVSNKESFVERARKLRIPLGDWFVSPLHPVEGDLNLWGYQWGDCPEAELACKEVINLFTDYPLTDQQLNDLFREELSQ